MNLKVWFSDLKHFLQQIADVTSAIRNQFSPEDHSGEGKREPDNPQGVHPGLNSANADVGIKDVPSAAVSDFPSESSIKNDKSILENDFPEGDHAQFCLAAMEGDPVSGVAGFPTMEQLFSPEILASMNIPDRMPQSEEPSSENLRELSNLMRQQTEELSWIRTYLEEMRGE